MADATHRTMPGGDMKQDPQAQKMRAEAQAKRDREARIKADQDAMIAKLRTPRPPAVPRPVTGK